MALTDIQVKTAKPKDKDYKLGDAHNYCGKITIECNQILQSFFIYPFGR